MDTKNTNNKKFKLNELLLKLQLLFFNQLLNIALILDLRKDYHNKDIIISDIMKYLEEQDDDTIDSFKELLDRNYLQNMIRESNQEIKDINIDNPNKNSYNKLIDSSIIYKFNSISFNEKKVKKRNYNEMIETNNPISFKNNNSTPIFDMKHEVDNYIEKMALKKYTENNNIKNVNLN